MPTRDVVALRDAARIGIADIEAGRFLTFETPADLARHLDLLTDEVLAGDADPEQGALAGSMNVEE